MKVCLICSEFFGWGKAGGFGFATRSIGRGLYDLGVEVSAVIPRPRGKHDSELEIDHIKIFSYPRYDFKRALNLFQLCDADIYHSQEPSLGSWLAQVAMSERAHVVTSRDPRLLKDWWIEFLYPTLSKFQVLKTCIHYENPLTYRAVRNADAVCCPARFLQTVVAQEIWVEKNASVSANAHRYNVYEEKKCHADCMLCRSMG